MSEESKTLRIRALKVENYKRIVAVELHPDGKSVVLGGRNAQGKSSLLDAIAAALGGKKKGGEQVALRTGSLRGEVVVDLGDYIVKRSWTPAGDRLVVEDPKGSVYKSPQGLLDKMLGDISFDPLGFMRLEPRAQAETLRKLVGLDVSDLVAKHGAAYQRRTQVNAEHAKAKAAIEQLPPEPPAPPAKPSVGALLARRDELQRRLADVDAIERLRKEIAELTVKASPAQAQACEASRKMADELEATLDRMAAVQNQPEPAADRVRHLQVAVEELIHCLNDCRVEADDMRLAAEEMLAEKMRQHDAHHLAAVDPAAARFAVQSDLDQVAKSLSETDAAIAAWEEASRAHARWKGLHQVQAQKVKLVDDLAAQSKALTAELEAIEQERLERLAKTTFPVDGLALDGDVITFRGLPLAQASQAERLRVCVAISAALNPRIGLALIREGAFLDDEGLQHVLASVEAMGLQAWVEVVGDRKGVGIIIEDGRALEAPGAAAEG